MSAPGVTRYDPTADNTVHPRAWIEFYTGRLWFAEGNDVALILGG